MRALRLPALLTLASVACATPGKRPPSASATPPPAAASETEPLRPPPPPPPPPKGQTAPAYQRPEVAELREEAHDLLQQQSELAWKNWALGEQVNLEQTYAGHSDLFSLSSLNTIRNARKDASGDAERALRNFELYVAGELLAKETAKLTDEIANLEARETVSVDGVKIPYRDIDRTLANEAAAAQRAKVYSAETAVLAKLNPLLEQKQQKIEAGLKTLGYKSYAELGAQLRDVDLDALSRLAEKTLTDTEALYTQAMGKLANDELAVPLSKLKRSDIPRLFRGTTNEVAFPGQSLVPTAQSILLGLGIDIKKQPGLTLNTAALPRKNPRAVCIAIEVPTDVRVSVKPKGGAEDYRALMHELGHAQHYTNTLRTEWEFQQLGNSTVAEAYSFLTEGIIDNPLWLGSATKMKDDELQQFVQHAAAEKLYMLRRYAAKVLFEVQWHSGKLNEPPAAAYKRILSRAYGFPLTDEDSQRYLVDHDDFFYSADYFRAWFLAAQLDQYLSKYYGAHWWDSSEAGRFLKALWAYGTQPTADEIAQRLGAKGVDPSALLQTLTARLGK